MGTTERIGEVQTLLLTPPPTGWPDTKCPEPQPAHPDECAKDPAERESVSQTRGNAAGTQPREEPVWGLAAAQPQVPGPREGPRGLLAAHRGTGYRAQRLPKTHPVLQASPRGLAALQAPRATWGDPAPRPKHVNLVLGPGWLAAGVSAPTERAPPRRTSMAAVASENHRASVWAPRKGPRFR